MSTPETEPARRIETILRNKLLPPRLHANTIHRGDLLARLDMGLTKKLTLVAAPTGFGKTMLVRQWIESGEFQAAWVTLDEYDNDPVRFWTYVCSALRTIDASLGRDSLSMLAGPQPASFANLLTPLINDLARLETRCVLVLDDYHTIKSTDIHAGISFLIQHLPEALHLVFITRTDPNLPLGLLRARDELVEITTPDLRFNQTETEVFLQTITQMDVRHPPPIAPTDSGPHALSPPQFAGAST